MGMQYRLLISERGLESLPQSQVERRLCCEGADLDRGRKQVTEVFGPARIALLSQDPELYVALMFREFRDSGRNYFFSPSDRAWGEQVNDLHGDFLK